MRKHKNTFWKKVAMGMVFGLVLVGGLMIKADIIGVPYIVHAQGNTPAGQATTTGNQAVNQVKGTTPTPNPATDATNKANQQMNELINILVQLIKSLLVLLLPLNIMIGKLLSNDWVYLDGDAYKAIETIWILIRNIVNVIFAAILLVIAVSQIAAAVTGSESKNLAIKQVLPKFIFGLLFVNFSLLTCRVILDVGNLASTAAFSIANETGRNLFSSEGGNDDTVMKKFYCWPTAKGQEDTKTCLQKYPNPTTENLKTCQEAWLNSDDPTMRNCMGEKLFVAFGNAAVKKLYAQTKPEKIVGGGENSDMAMAWSDNPPSNIASALFGSRNVMFIYTNNIFRLPELLLLYDSQKTPGNNLAKVEGILIQTFLSLLYGAGILMVNIAFFLALAVRLVLIWMLLIFSPLMALEIVFPDKIKGLLGKAKFTKGMLKSLIDLSLMPAMVGIVLSVGFIIFSVLTTIINKTTGGVTTATGGIPKEIYKIPPFSIEISGSPLGNVFSTMGEFIVAIIILVVLWEAVFYMMQTGTMVDGIVKKVKGIGDSLAGSAKMIPFIPMPGGPKAGGGPKFVSAGSLSYATRALENTLARHEQTAAEKGLGGTWVGDVLGIKEMDEEQKARRDRYQSRATNTEWSKDNFKSVMQDFVKTNEKDTPDLRESGKLDFRTMLEKAGITDKDFMTKLNGALDQFYKNPTDQELLKVSPMLRDLESKMGNGTDAIFMREALREMNVFTDAFRQNPRQVVNNISGKDATSTSSSTTNGPAIKVITNADNRNYTIQLPSTEKAPDGKPKPNEVLIPKTLQVDRFVGAYNTANTAKYEAGKTKAATDFIGHLKTLGKELAKDPADATSRAKTILEEIGKLTKT